MTLHRLLRRVTAVPVVLLAAAVLFFEDVVWVLVERLAARWAAWPPIRAAEARIASWPAPVILSLFAVSGAVLYPLYAYTAWLTVTGHPTLGLALFVLLKLTGTSFAVRLFVIGRDKLLSFGWFALAYRALVRLKTLLYGLVTGHPAWQAARAAVGVLLARWRRAGGLYRRFRAARRLLTPGA